MTIVKMKRLRLLAMRGDREGLLRALQTLGCVELQEPSYGAGEAESTPPGGGAEAGA